MTVPHPTGLIIDPRFVTLRETRVTDPGRLAEIYADRRRGQLPADGRLLIIAADHPARGAVNGTVMANRYELLERLVTALSRPGVDGVLGTADIIDDLALLGVLDDKIVVGSMNRGGLVGSVFEMDDRFTGYSIAALAAQRLDFAKLLLRINLADPGTVATLETAADAVTAAAAARLPIMIEPFLSTRQDNRIRHDLTADGVIKSVGISAGLGDSSGYTWLKIPVVPDMERVMAATTLPTLLLGGEISADADQAYSRWADALALPGARGLVVGRQLLDPPDGDVAAAVDIAAKLVHQGGSR